MYNDYNYSRMVSVTWTNSHIFPRKISTQIVCPVINFDNLTSLPIKLNSSVQKEVYMTTNEIVEPFNVKSGLGVMIIVIEMNAVVWVLILNEAVFV